MGEGGEDSAFIGDTGRQDNVECRNPVGRDDQQRVANFIHITHFASDELREIWYVGMENDLAQGASISFTKT